MSELKKKHIEYKLLQNDYCIECNDKQCLPQACSKIGHLFATQFIKERSNIIETIKKELSRYGPPIADNFKTPIERSTAWAVSKVYHKTIMKVLDQFKEEKQCP